MGIVRNKRSDLTVVLRRNTLPAGLPAISLSLVLLGLVTAAAVMLAGRPALVTAAAGAHAADDSPARQLFQLLNGERVKAGLPPLVWDDLLAEAAVQHSQLLSKRKQLSHQFPGEPSLQQRLQGIPLATSGENVAVGPSVADAHNGLMHSPPHRANILSPKFDAGGIGIVETGTNLWVTEDFAHRIQQMSAQTAADQVAKAFAQARRKAGTPAIERTDSSRIAALACAMARRDKLDTSKPLELPEAHYAVAYTATNVAELPENVVRLRSAQDVKRYAVGVCFERTSTYPSGVYWVVLVLFRK
jgi:cysteine-rich secretory family protein